MPVLNVPAALVWAQPQSSPDPFQWPDYGGTPDIPVAEGVGLSTAELDNYLSNLSSPSQSDRAKAVRDIVMNAPGSEQTFQKALWARHGATNAEMKTAIRTAVKQRGASQGDPALVDALVAIPREHHTALSRGVLGALRILSMLQGLNTLNTLAAYKIMIAFSPRHAGVFRHHIGQMIVAHGLDALPPLVYSRGSDNPEIRMFAVKWIRDMGNPLLSEQVKIKNPRRLAQLLEAYASVNDLDVIQVTLSLTNHDAIFVRTAARKCTALYGRNARWPLHRLYENTFGETPPKTADADKMASKLYAYFDAQRLRPMMQQFDAGLAAYRAGRLEQMATAYRDVLKHEPMFPKRREMAEGFWAFSNALSRQDRTDEAMTMLRLAERTADMASPLGKRIRAHRLFLEAEALRETGLIDPARYVEVIERDPEHEAAIARLREVTQPHAPSEKLAMKSLIVSFVVFCAALLVYVRLRG